MIKWWKHQNIENNNVISNYFSFQFCSVELYAFRTQMKANEEVRRLAVHWVSVEIVSDIRSSCSFLECEKK